MKTAETLIIGAGLTGLMCAEFLRQRGIESTVIESESHNSPSPHLACLTMENELKLGEINNEIDLDSAKEYAENARQAILNFKKTVFREKIDCGYEETENIIYSARQSIEREKETLKLLSLPFHSSNSASPFGQRNSVCLPYACVFDMEKLFEYLKSNAKVDYCTTAKSIEGNIVYTDKGAYKCKNIIAANHCTVSSNGKTHRNYICRMKNAKIVNGIYTDEISGIKLISGKTKSYAVMSGEKCNNDFDEFEKTVKEYFPNCQADMIWCQNASKTALVPQVKKIKGTSVISCTGYDRLNCTDAVICAEKAADMVSARYIDSLLGA